MAEKKKKRYVETCSACKGSGEVPQKIEDDFDGQRISFVSHQACGSCGGSGEVNLVEKAKAVLERYEKERVEWDKKNSRGNTGCALFWVFGIALSGSFVMHHLFQLSATVPHIFLVLTIFAVVVAIIGDDSDELGSFRRREFWDLEGKAENAERFLESVERERELEIESDLSHDDTDEAWINFPEGRYYNSTST